MGLFAKKFCDICGEQIKFLGNRKVEDGNMCKNCADKLSPWFSDRRRTTLNDIKEQLRDREANKARVAAFRADTTLGEMAKVLIDRRKVTESTYVRRVEPGIYIVKVNNIAKSLRTDLRR